MLPGDEIPGRYVMNLQCPVAPIPFAVSIASLKEIEEVKGAVVPERDAITRLGIVTARSEVLDVARKGPEQVGVAMRRVLRTAAKPHDLFV